MKKTLTLIAFFNLILLSSNAFASENIALSYNVLPELSNGSVVDAAHTDKINFSLFESEKDLFYKGTELDISNNAFSISIEGLQGMQEFVLENSNGEKVTYTYYISDEKGFVDSYSFNELKDVKHKVFVKHVENVQILYTDKESKVIKELEKVISSLPADVISNVKEMKLLPVASKSKATAVTNDNKITFYKLSSYSSKTFKNIVIHEIAHTWARKLMQEKVIDYSYTEYQKAVNSDKKSPSNYAKQNVKVGNYNEDFAESVSFYFIDMKSFAKSYPARASYIANLL